MEEAIIQMKESIIQVALIRIPSVFNFCFWCIHKFSWRLENMASFYESWLIYSFFNSNRDSSDAMLAIIYNRHLQSILLSLSLTHTHTHTTSISLPYKYKHTYTLSLSLPLSPPFYVCVCFWLCLSLFIFLYIFK